MTFVYLDCETTGLNPKTNSICQLSGIVTKDGRQESFNYYIKPYKDFDTLVDTDTTFSGTPISEIKQYPSVEEVYNQFINLLDSFNIGASWTDKAYIIGYNSAFDTEFLREFFEHNNDKRYGYRFNWPDLDVARFAAIYLMGRRSSMRNFKLETVYNEIFGHPFENAHDSMSDVIATKEIWDFLAEKMLKSLTENVTVKGKVPIREIKQ